LQNPQKSINETKPRKSLIFIVPNHLDILAYLNNHTDEADETAERYEPVHPEVGNPHTKGDLVPVSSCIISAIPDHYHKHQNDHGEVEKTGDTADGFRQGVHDAVYLYMVIAEYTDSNSPEGSEGKYKRDKFFHLPEGDIKTVTGDYRENHTARH
jgi:hypothetical protein